MHRCADILEAEVETFANTISLEMGKTLVAARAEVLKSALGARFYADNAESFLADEPADAGGVGATAAYVRWEPLGAIFAIMPWNYPFWQVMRFAAPTLMAGNVGILKHASNVPRCALALEDLFERAGFPVGVFQTLLVEPDAVESVLSDPRVAAVTITAGEAAGRAVGVIAGRAIKKSVMELGGNDAFIVMPSSNLAEAAAVGAKSRCQNNGQSCIAAKRFIVHEDVVDEFSALLTAAMAALVVGDPLEASTDVGPLATQRAVIDVDAAVRSAVEEGGRVLLGGQRLERDGWFYPPTVLTDLKSTMRIHDQEVFGPVAQIYAVPNLDAAIALANATELGLSSSGWTTDVDEQDRIVAELAVGAVFVNGMSASYPELPFGGVKGSGHGRELAAMGIKEFCNAKTVWVRR
jgi:succinate-semialdehyde dehydrogenase/glutarate-semialdehyde dehydrogenase